MANEFEAKVDIDTTQAAAGLKAVDKSVENLDKTIKSLDGSLKNMQSSLSATARALQDSNKAQREAAAAADKTAAANVKAARARELDSRAALNASRTAALERRERDAMARSNEGAANSFQAVTGAVRGYTAGAQEAVNTNAALSGSMSNTRYLLYDIGATYSAISLALLAVPAATTAVAMSYEKSFAQVERTTGGASQATQALKGDLMELGESIPLAFGELTKIAGLGAQLGVPTEALTAFTEVVAKFSASTGVAAEEAGAAFGRIGSAFGLGADQYDNLGSAIAKVGVSSAATETEIIAITQQLAPLASLAGFSAQEVVGLSGALASMRIRPELARGAFQSTIFKITEATEAGGKSLQAYADIMGLTQDQVTNLFKSNPAEFFDQYITGIGKAMEGGQSFSSILDTLGVKEKRERQFILAMANQYGFLSDQIGLANDAYAEGTFLDEASAAVFATLAANLQKLGNSLANLGASLGGGSLKGLSALVNALAGGVQGVTDLVNTVPMLGEVLSVLLGFGAVAGVFFMVRSAMAFVLAAMVGFQQVASRSALTTTFSLKGIAAQAAVTRLVTQGATAQMAGDYVRAAGIIRASSASVVTSTNGMGTAIVNTGGKFKAFGAMALGAIGGLPGLVIGALAAVGMGMMDAGAQAELAGTAIANAFEQGNAEGLKAISDQLSTTKADFNSSGIAFETYGKSVKELGERAGVSLEQMVTAISKGKDAGKELAPILDDIARDRGYKNFQEFSDLDTAAAGLIMVRNKVEELGGQYATTKQDAADTNEVVKKLGGEGAEAMVELEGGADGASKSFDNLNTNIEDAVAAIFGLQNAESAAHEALYRLGESLHNSNDLSIDSEGGRENLDNAQTAVTRYAQALAQAQAQGKISAEQAAVDYAAFIDGLFNDLVARGVDPAQAAQFIEMAKGVMGATAASGAPVKVPVGTDTAEAHNAGVEAGAAVEAGVQTASPTAHVDADTNPAAEAVRHIQMFLSGLTQQPFVAPVDADISAGVQNTQNFDFFARQTTEGGYTAPVNADTSAALTNLQNLANFAQTVISAIQYGINMVTSNMGEAQSRKPSVSAEIGNVKVGGARESASAGPVPKQQAAPVIPQTAAPAVIPTPATASPQRALGNLGKGYDNAAQAAKKAGDAGKKAGEDAANGINDAAEAANDYANRLKQGLTAAYDMQHGVAKATDDYYTQLNTINKKREDELQTISDLVAKQKELNIARQGDLVAARKAQIEAEISEKYGEVDRAEDYRVQAAEATNAAAEKQRNIDVALKEQMTLQSGIGKLDGYSQAAIDNREALRSLEAKTLDMIVAYAASGASIDQVRNYAAGLNTQFRRDAQQIGYNIVQIDGLTGNLWRYIGVINAVPYHKPTKVTADVGGPGHGATGAVNGFNGAANHAARHRTAVFDADTTALRAKMDEAFRQYEAIFGKSGKTAGLFAAQNGGPGYYRGGLVGYASGGQVQGYASGGLIPGKSPNNPNVDNLMAKVDGRNNIMVRSGEYIVSEPAVKKFGVDYFDALNNLRVPRYNVGGPVPGGSASSGSGDSGPVLVELTAENLRTILRVADRPVDLYMDIEKVASSVAQGNDILASKGVH